MMPFSKPFLAVPEQLILLKSRGLTITDDIRATAALERIGYYRLSGYWYPLRVWGHYTICTKSYAKPNSPRQAVFRKRGYVNGAILDGESRGLPFQNPVANLG